MTVWRTFKRRYQTWIHWLSFAILFEIYRKDLHRSIFQMSDVNQKGFDAIGKSKFLDRKVIEFLIDLGFDVNSNNQEGKTLLHYCVNSWDMNFEVVKCLLEHGADVNFADANNQTPFLNVLRKVCPPDRSSGTPVVKMWYFGGWILPTQEQRVMMEKYLKYLLFYNPNPDIHPDALRLTMDAACVLGGYSNLPFIPSDPDLSLFAVLLELGFTMEDMENVDINKEPKYPKFYEYYKSYKSSPRSLKSACRVKIRQTYLGFRLHEFVKNVHMPKIIQEYILCEKLLFSEGKGIIESGQER